MGVIVTGWETRTNLCTNPSFEVDTTAWGKALTEDAVSVVDTDSVYGTKCLQVDAAAGAGSHGTSTPSTASLEPITAGASYFASAWVKVPIGQTIRFQVNFQTAAGAFVNAFVTSPVAQEGTGAWEHLKVSGIAGAGAAMARIFITQPAPAEAFTFFVDGVLLEQASEHAPYFPNPAQLASGEAVENEDGSFTLTPFNRAGFASGSSACIVNPPA